MGDKAFYLVPKYQRIPSRMYWMPMAAVSSAISPDITSDPELPKNLYMGSISLRMTCTTAKTNRTAVMVTNTPDACKVKIVVVMAPGPTRRGKPMGTTPMCSGVVEFSVHSPRTIILIEIIRSSMPPAIMKLWRDIPKNMNMYWPISAKDSRITKPVSTALRKALRLSPFASPLVKPMKIGMFPNGSIIMNNVIIALNKAKINSMIETRTFLYP